MGNYKNMLQEDNFKIIYEEVNELHKYQQQSIDLIYSKLNWILVSDAVLLAALYSDEFSNILTLFLVSLSAIISLFGFTLKKFKHTAKISDQIDLVNNNAFLESLIKKKNQALIKNRFIVKKLEKSLKYSQWLLIAAILIQFLILIF